MVLMEVPFQDGKSREGAVLKEYFERSNLPEGTVEKIYFGIGSGSTELRL